MATPFPFQSAAVLTAAQMNAITTLPTSTKTASHTLTISDVGTRVIMNSASATTITVNTSIFGASDVVEILNIGAGVCTVTAGTCTVSTSASLALVQNAGGTLTFISASASVFRASGVAASASGLVRVGGGTLSGASTTFSSVFSATYNSYLIIGNATSASTGVTEIGLRLGATATGYRYAGTLNYFNGITPAASASNAATSMLLSYTGDGYAPILCEVIAPQLATHTFFGSKGIRSTNNENSMFHNGGLLDTTQYTACTLVISSGTFSGGVVGIYGYSLS